MKTYTLSTRSYLDPHRKCYKNIIVINMIPEGPLHVLTRRMKLEKLSPFKTQDMGCSQNNICNYVIQSIHNNQELMCLQELPTLFTYLNENGYTINTRVTSMIHDNNIQLNTETSNKIICFLNYVNN